MELKGDCTIFYFATDRSAGDQVMSILTSTQRLIYRYDEMYEPKRHNSEIITRQGTKYIILLHDNLILADKYQYRSLASGFFDEVIRSMDTMTQSGTDMNNILGLLYPTHCYHFGTTYNVAVLRYDHLVENITDYTPNLTTLRRNMGSKGLILKMAPPRQYLGFYNAYGFGASRTDVEISTMFSRITRDLLAKNYFMADYVVELFRKYRLFKVDDLRRLMRTWIPSDRFDRATRSIADILTYVNNVDPEDIERMRSKIALSTSDVVRTYDWHAFIGIIQQIVGTDWSVGIPPAVPSPRWRVAFIMNHYLENNNFERKINFYYTMLKQMNFEAGIILSSRTRVPFVHHFEYDDVRVVHGNTLCTFATENGIKKLAFVDNVPVNILPDINQKIVRDELEVYMVLSGYISYLNKYVPTLAESNTSNPPLKLIKLKKIITNNPSHRILFDRPEYRIPTYVCRMTDLRHGIPTSLEVHLKERLTKKFVYVGRFSPEKLLEVLLISFGRFVTSHPEYRLLIVGFGPVPVGDIITTHKVKNVDIIDRWCSSEEVERHISESDFLILPTCSEGTPNVVNEAFQLGIPVVASDVRGTREMILPGKNGFLFEVTGYDRVADQLYWNYDTVLSEIEKYKEATVSTLYRSLVKVATEVDLTRYHHLQRGASQSFIDFVAERTDIIDMFDLR